MTPRPQMPLAIVGRACVLPGALTPRALGNIAIEGRDVVTDVPEGRFRIDPSLVRGTPHDAVDRTWSARGGYVRGFSLDTAGLDLSSIPDVEALDPLFHWVLSVGRDALADAGFGTSGRGATRMRAGAVLGNLSFPTEAMTLLGEQQALGPLAVKVGGPWARPVDARNAQMSGLPAQMLARALHLDEAHGGIGAFALDAACASSLYALRLAALALEEGRADVMLAGAVNRADALFLHVGFCALQALSATGRSRPFDVAADGLVPAEGCAMVALMRLDDAIAQRKRIHGVIRGVGLSNDGRSRNLLAPSSEGQVRALRAAWSAAQMAPSDVDVFECHATGTQMGDRTEVESVIALLEGAREQVPLGSLKSNMGHLITAAGVAGLLKVTEAMARETLPPTLHVDTPLALFTPDAPVRVQREAAPWRTVGGRARRAGVSAFGFGGNNAHVVLEQYEPRMGSVVVSMATESSYRGELVVVAHALRAAAGEVSVALEGLRFPPNDLKEALPQQLLVFEAARDAVRSLEAALGAEAVRERALPSLRTGVFIGMGTDMRVTLPGVRWRAPAIAARLAGDAHGALVRALRDAAMPAMNAQAVLGCMPNIPANRLNVQLDARGPGFTVSAEDRSTAAAFETARMLIAAGEICAAIVGATDGAEGAAAFVVMDGLRAKDLGLAALAIGTEGSRLPGTGPGAATAADAARLPGTGPGAATAADAARLPGTGPGRRGVAVASAALSLSRAVPRAPHVMAVGAPTKRELIAKLRTATTDACATPESADGPWRAVAVVDDATSLGAACGALAARLATTDRVDDEAAGLWAREAPALAREQIALLCGTATQLEPGFADELRRAFPHAFASLARDVGAEELDDALALTHASARGCLADLFAASASMQLSTRILRDALGVSFGKALGISLGESNALFASGAWRDLRAMMIDMDRSRIFDEVLAHDGRPGGRADWRAVLARAPVAAAREACAQAGAHLLVIHAPDEVELGGTPARVDEALRLLASTNALAGHVPLAHMPVVHCAQLASLGASDLYRCIHRRRVHETDVVIYGHAARAPMTLNDDAVADALLAQALDTVDFPALLDRVARDGARVFIDVSPRGLAGAWAQRTRNDVDVISLGHDVRSVAVAAARMAVAGVPVSFTHLRTLAPLGTSGAVLRVPAPRAPGPFPAGGPAVSGELMAAAPALPRILPVSAPAPVISTPPEVTNPSPDVDALALAYAEQRAAARAAQQGLMDAMSQAHRMFLAHREALAARVVALAGGPDADVQPGRRPLWSREDLERLASGRISDVWGPPFDVQDAFRRQVRMPEPPLLLADRVISIDATPGVLEKNRNIVTETDVRWDAWYLHEGRCPAGVLIETGQADLLLVSYMGVDFENKGERVYRLLGCDLTYNARLPLAGTTLRHDIHVDGYATAPMKHGDVRIFFFHSDTCALETDANVLSVRNGQAGFFTDEELAGSGGILWTPADVDAAALATLPLATPPSPTAKRTLARDELVAFSRGDARACFGFDRAGPHVRTPRIPEGRLLLVDRVSELDYRGGPWQRGYMRAELDLATPERATSGLPWFLEGHFKDDPCMPGTLMFEGCLEALAIYLAGAGFTLDRDGFVFEPAVGEVFKLRCRGQATPSSKKLVYELFIRAMTDGAEPTVTADILVTVDGLKSLYCEAVTLALRADWPLSSHPELTGAVPKAAGWDAVGGVLANDDAGAVYGQRALLATGIGKPSEALPGLYEPFDGGRRVPRLPGPPYHFMSRVMHVGGPALGSLARGESAAGTVAVVEYDVPPEAWYFDASTTSQASTMPFAVLLEIALQPCGWISSYVGSALTTDDDLSYRNLDGDARLFREVARDVGTLVVRAELTKSSASSGMIIQELSFHVSEKRSGDVVFSGTTVFGFFPPDALARQVGIAAAPEERARIAERCAVVADLRARDARYCDGPLALPAPMLTMIDRVCSYDATGSPAGRARVRTEKDIDAGEWFFKAHFFQDPVQPGSLGVEAMIQALMWTAIHERRHDGMAQPRFEALAVDPTAGERVVWKYRGQVVPKNRTVTCELDVMSVNEDRATGAVTLRANATLWVDGTKIYAATGLALRIVDDDAR